MNADRRRAAPPWRTTHRDLWSLVVLVMPLFALVLAVREGWHPEGDDATIVLRARELLNGQLPLQGMRSTAGAGDPDLVNHHLGPLELHLLFPASIVGTGWAVALTCTAIAAITSVAAIRWGHRLGGDPAVVVFGTGVLVLQCALGPEAMFRPFNPYVGLLPIYLSLVLLAAHLAGRAGVGWPLVLTTGLVAQANLAYAFIGLGVAGAACAVSVGRVVASHSRRSRVTTVRRRLRRGRSWSTALLRHRFSRGEKLSLAVAALVWAPVLVEPLRHQPGNLMQLARAFLSDSPSQGLGWAVQRLAMFAPFPDGFRGLGPDLVYPHGAAATVIGAVVLVLLVVAALAVGSAGTRPVATHPARAALVGVLLLVPTLASLPTTGLANHHMAGTIPIVVFAWAAVAWRVALHVRRVPRHFPHTVGLRAGVSAACLSLVLLALSPSVRFMTSDIGREAGGLVVEELGGLPAGSHVVVVGRGYIGSLSTAPSVALDLELAGLSAHYLFPWPSSEDAARLAVARAPSGSVHVTLIGSNAEDRTPPAGARPVGTVGTGPMTIDVYVDRPA